MALQSMVAIGRLRHQVILQYPNPVRDTNGDEAITWVDIATVWAEILPMSGRLLFEAQLVKANISHKITIRHLDALTPTWRVKFGDRTFNIDYKIDIQEQNRFLELYCTEITQ